MCKRRTVTERKNCFMENFRLFKIDVFLDIYFSQQIVQMDLSIYNYQCHSWKNNTSEETSGKERTKFSSVIRVTVSQTRTSQINQNLAQFFIPYLLKNLNGGNY